MSQVMSQVRPPVSGDHSGDHFGATVRRMSATAAPEVSQCLCLLCWAHSPQSSTLSLGQGEYLHVGNLAFKD